VQRAYDVTGDNDFVLIVCAPDVQRHTTRVVLLPAKRGLAIPVDGA
jgi:hypothetical protein